MERCMGCRRPKPLQYRQAAFRAQRDKARAFLRWLASSAVPDVFTWQSARRPYFEYEFYVFEFLRQHGFITRLNRRKPAEFCLSEQAIRWLDWTNFNWRGAA